MLKNPVNVLIVDDEASICALIKAEFSGRGFHCLTATEPAQALQLLESQHIQLLISDIMMPGMSGLELLAHVKRVLPQCKVILMTAASNREFLAQAIMLGAYDYVEKPFDIEELYTVAIKATGGDSDKSQLFQRAAAAMELSSQAKQASLDSVRALVRAVEAKDPYTRRHCEQVASYAVSLARAMKLPETTVESIRVASLLHDIGKIGVPDHILTKPGPLTPEEYQHIQRHAALGADILSNVTMFTKEAQMVRHHHERWDGGGYPDGLVGEQTPLASRIMQVSDCIDAMLMERTYKKSYPVQRMLDELMAAAGKQFDPVIAEAAARLAGA